MEHHSPKVAIGNISMLHVSMAGMSALFGLVVSILHFSGSTAGQQEGFELFLYLPAGAILIAFPVSTLLFKNQLKTSLESNVALQEKMTAFTTAHLIRMALFEAVA
ncbi:MAG: hypothetical protein OEY56_12580, partial [Cyclobacteriaceae bacterium]|nr:hypothetical protein [Cyclobacteriaceae bacterium]